MQNWERLYHYIHEWQNLVYSYYSVHGVAFLTTYYNLNKDETIWDDTQLFGGAYERTGPYTGIKWDKYLLLPVYFTEEMTSAFDGSDIGLIKEQESTIVIPSIYGVTPYAGDFVKFEQEFLRPTNDTYPVYIVTGAEIHPNTDRRFWKIRVKTHQSKSVNAIEDQVEDIYVFFDYDKKIHTLEDATTLARMLSKNETLRGRLKDMWDENSGFYQV